MNESRVARDRLLALELSDKIAGQKSVFAGARGALGMVKSLFDKEISDAQACHDLLDQLKAQTFYTLLAYVDASGTIRCSSQSADPVDISSRETWQRLNASRSFTAVTLVGAVSRQPVLVMLDPIFRDGEFAGAIALSITQATIRSLLRDVPLDRDLHVVISDANGRELASTRGDAFPPVDAALRARLVAQHGPIEIETESGDEVLLVAEPLLDGHLTAMAAWPGTIAENRIFANAALGIAMPLIAWLSAIGIAYFVINRLVLQNVLQLKQTARRLRQGDLEARSQIEEDAPLEFAELSETFDEMAQAVQRRDQSLRDALDDQRLLLREVYHRVRNNLQLILSLLNMKMRQASNEGERQLIARIRNRVQAMATVQQHVYQEENLSKAPLDHIVDGIVRARHADYQLADQQVGKGDAGLRLDLAPIAIDADRAMAAAMLADEALTTLKAGDGQAPPHGQAAVQGKPAVHDKAAVNGILIVLEETEDGKARLSFSSSGGVAPDAAKTTQGTALPLMKGFARQLRADLQIVRTEAESQITVTFPIDSLSEARLSKRSTQVD
ncbi:MAG: HAMP domain-containing protein [Neomegalonema sp.]|nr:HAMP domain-containing protein [Neomegalonema sp.]